MLCVISQIEMHDKQHVRSLEFLRAEESWLSFGRRGRWFESNTVQHYGRLAQWLER